MPRPAKIDRHTNAMIPPEDWDEAANGHCGTLYTRVEEIDGIRFMHSAWDVEPTEALLMLGGAKMVLGVSGIRHPVVHLRVEQLPDSFSPVHMVREIALLDGRPAVRVDSMYCSGEAEGQTVYCERLVVDGDVPAATAAAMREVEGLARSNGWLKDQDRG